MSHLLELAGLEVRYGKVAAVSGVDLAVDEGHVVTVLGRNGAGKSSLLRAAAGLVRPTGGTVSFRGRDVTRLPADRRARLGIALVPEGRRVFRNVTVAENLLLGGFGRPAGEREAAIDAVLRLFPVLAERSDALGSELSGGQQQMLALARALVGEPEVLMLDEPSLGLAPLVVDEVYVHLRRLRDSGIGIVLVEQHVDRALAFADHAVVLSLGTVVAEGEASGLRRDPRLVAAYLGDRGG